MSSVDPLQAARAGDRAAFEALVSPYRRELNAHCYRLTGSLAEAEDLLQDSLLQAWRGIAGFEGRSSLRTWLYRIATHACLRALERSRNRLLPNDTHGPGDRPPPASADEAFWLEPCPEVMWQDAAPGPEARYSASESVAVAFLTALQHLPPQQRAVLVLREVMGWSAAEVAELLDTTPAATNSALQRARATLDERKATLEGTHLLDRDDASTATLLRRYLDAWTQGDAGALAQLLREDAVMTMPPMPASYQGRDGICGFLSAIFRQMGPMRAVPVEVSGGAGAAVYLRAPEGRHFALQSVHALRGAADGRLATLDIFMDPRVVTRFGLEPTLPI